MGTTDKGVVMRFFKLGLLCLSMCSLPINSDTVQGKIKMELWPHEPCSNIVGACIEL